MPAPELPVAPVQSDDKTKPKKDEIDPKGKAKDEKNADGAEEEELVSINSTRSFDNWIHEIHHFSRRRTSNFEMSLRC